LVRSLLIYRTRYEAAGYFVLTPGTFFTATLARSLTIPAHPQLEAIYTRFAFHTGKVCESMSVPVEVSRTSAFAV
jgi:hypothetical protein